MKHWNSHTKLRTDMPVRSIRWNGRLCLVTLTNGQGLTLTEKQALDIGLFQKNKPVVDLRSKRHRFATGKG